MKTILISIDTLRADHLGCYGYHRSTSPNVDRLAQEGALFTRAYATDVPTQPCYTSILTGKRGVTTGIVTHGQPEETVPDTLPMFQHVLAEKGYLTASVSTLVTFRKWFARGFVHNIRPSMATHLQRVSADDINAHALPWLRVHAKEDFFLFVHYWDPHTPYRLVPQEYLDRFYEGDPYDPINRSLEPLWQQADLYQRWKRMLTEEGGEVTDLGYVVAQYDGEIAYADAKVGELLDLLDELGIAEETLVILISDHGESFGEHTVYFDHATAYDEVARIPLVLRYSPRIPAGQQIEALVQLIDIAPTALELFGVGASEEFEGRSLWPLLTGEVDRGYEVVFTNQGLWTAQRAMRTDQWGLVKTMDPGLWDLPPVELYDIQKDPSEETNLADKEADARGELELQYYRWLEEKLGNRPDPLRVEAARGMLLSRRVRISVNEFRTRRQTAQ